MPVSETARRIFRLRCLYTSLLPSLICLGFVLLRNLYHPAPLDFHYLQWCSGWSAVVFDPSNNIHSTHYLSENHVAIVKPGRGFRRDENCNPNDGFRVSNTSNAGLVKICFKCVSRTRKGRHSNGRLTLRPIGVFPGIGHG